MMYKLPQLRVELMLIILLQNARKNSRVKKFVSLLTKKKNKQKIFTVPYLNA